MIGSLFNTSKRRRLLPDSRKLKSKQKIKGFESYILWQS